MLKNYFWGNGVSLTMPHLARTVTVLTRETIPCQSGSHQISPPWDALEICFLIAMLSLEPMHRKLLILVLTSCTGIFKNKMIYL